MSASRDDFCAARSKLEAVARISALTHSPPETLGPGSKERKTVLVNLSMGLGLDVDTTRNKPDLGAAIAKALGVPWDATCWSAGNTITLHGLNRLLDGAQRRVAARRSAPQLVLFEPMSAATSEFVPARSKLEAVTRLSALTNSPPETLGPGSKERKSALVNLASGLGLRVDASASKPKLGAQIAHALGSTWDESCWSAGHTVTLDGLNRLLAAGEARVKSIAPQGGLFRSAADEARALLTALSAAVPAHLDGRRSVDEMREAQYTQWAQDEWAAFYFEFVGLPALINAFGGGPRSFANTRFDYGLGHTWDLKVHMAATGTTPLNDCVAVDLALTSGSGVGFLVLTGDVTYDSGEFRRWQREYRALHGKKAKTRARPPTYVRKSKAAFKPRMIEAFFLPNSQELGTALAQGAFGVMRQGRQTSGSERPPKYSLNLVKARFSSLLLEQRLI